MKTKAIIVDINNNPIGYKNRSDLNSDDIYRISAARIADSSGNILLAQRSWNKKKSPWKWWPAAAWTLEEWDTYESNIIKEIKEEIGIKIILDQLQPQAIEYHEWSWWTNRCFIQWFIWVYDWDKSLLQKQDEEVETLKRFSKKELQQELKQYPEIFLTSVSQKLQDFVTL